MYELQREHEWFFFTPRVKKFAGGSRPDRVANNGYWKATGAVTPVIHSNNKIVGYKSILVFYEGHRPNSKKTNWIMHEYTLEKHNSASCKSKASSDMKVHIHTHIDFHPIYVSYLHRYRECLNELFHFAKISLTFNPEEVGIV